MSGGAARGLAHIGVLSVLEEHKIPIDLVVGASFGSIVAAHYLYGYKIEEMIEYSRSFRLWSIRDLGPPWTSFFSGEKAERIFESTLGNVKIEELRIPFIVLAADLDREEPFLFERGKLSTALRASSAFPGLFEPLRFGDRLLADGGIVDSISVLTARERGADIVISCDVSVLSRIKKVPLFSFPMRWIVSRAGKKKAPGKSGSLRYVLHHTLRIIKRYRDSGGETADFTIEPLGGQVKPLSFGKVDECFGLGREAAMRVIDSVTRRVYGNMNRGGPGRPTHT